MTRYRIYRNSAGDTTYISAHEKNRFCDPTEFPNLDTALAVLRQCGIPEYEIRRVAKELCAINGAIVQVPEPIVFAELSGIPNLAIVTDSLMMVPREKTDGSDEARRLDTPHHTDGPSIFPISSQCAVCKLDKRILHP
jgi:hypothetical protein